jgi:hypothetical protein
MLQNSSCFGQGYELDDQQVSKTTPLEYAYLIRKTNKSSHLNDDDRYKILIGDADSCCMDQGEPGVDYDEPNLNR